jgi:predicted exporter/SAM-dependent methyltransferase
MGPAKPTQSFNLRLFVSILCAIAVLLGLSFYLTDIDTDIVRFLPRRNAVLDDAAYIFEHHPIQSEMVVDLEIDPPDPDRLVQLADRVEQRMRRSGLFKRVGTASMQQLVPDMIRHIVDNLPVMLTRQELEAQVQPMLEPGRIARRLASLQAQLYNLDAIGQAALISRDPLELRNIVMAKLAHLAPARNVEIYKGKLVSKDRRHLLILATPAASATETLNAREIHDLMTGVAHELDTGRDGGTQVRLTPMGAYRAALDNEIIARRDVQKAILLATVGIALLLILAFPRPLIGLFAFLPAVAGTVCAFFVLALMHDTISIMALGFGGAIISITVDHGIAYLLFLDRSCFSSGRQASKEIWAIGLMAALTTIGAFATLCLSGFPVFIQLGQFTALGIAFSFLFVHTVFPRIFPQLPPAGKRALPFRRMVERLPAAGKRAAVVAALFFCIMLVFANPRFNVSLSSMNTVSRETQAAQQRISDVWGGGIFSRIYLLTESRTDSALQQSNDQLLSLVEQDLQEGRLATGFVGAMLFPGPDRRRENFRAWQAFWTPDKQQQTRTAFARASGLGFTTDAFAPFFDAVSSADVGTASVQVPEQFYPLIGMAKRDDGSVIQFSTLAPGPEYDPQRLYQRYGTLAHTRLFDPTYFSRQLGQLLFSTFVKMLAIIGCSVAVLLFFFFLDLRLTLICLTPVLFALVCTLGSLKLIGHPLDIPALMLAIIVLGMGIDYALFLVRAYQRYGGTDHASFERIKLAVIMAAVSTLIGFGVLCLAEHALLRSAGITSLLGIGYSVVGAFVLLPPLLKRHFTPGKLAFDSSTSWRRRVLARYRTMGTVPLWAARSRLKTDSVFDELAHQLDGSGTIETVVDIGCGYGLAGSWLVERHPEAFIYGSEANREKARVADVALGDRGRVFHLKAPDVPEPPSPVDVALLINVVHKLDDTVFVRTLEHLRKTLRPDGRLIIRVPLPKAHGSGGGWGRRLQVLIGRITGDPTLLRTEKTLRREICQAGFHVTACLPSCGRQDLRWFVAMPEAAPRPDTN